MMRQCWANSRSHDAKLNRQHIADKIADKLPRIPRISAEARGSEWVSPFIISHLDNDCIILLLLLLLLLYSYYIFALPKTNRFLARPSSVFCGLTYPLFPMGSSVSDDRRASVGPSPWFATKRWPFFSLPTTNAREGVPFRENSTV